MPVEANKALVRRWMDEVMTGGDLALMDELLVDAVSVRVGGSVLTGRDALRQANERVRPAMQQMHCSIDDIVAEGDLVACRYTSTFTHAGEFMGVPATGEQIVEHGIMIARITDGRIAEFWDQPDTLGLLQQLGALPSIGQMPT